MRFSTCLIALAAPYLVSALPFKAKRAAAADILVLQFADVLEQLESQFYSEALSTFQIADFVTAGFSDAQIPIQLFTNIQVDESTHSTILQAAIKAEGAQPLSGCKFDFSSVLTDVATMAATARLVENVGVGAYLGAATLLTDPQLLSAAATILTIEARHQTILNLIAGGTAIPASFDIALTPPQVLAIAGAFISGCDTGITSNTPLAVTNKGTVAVGTTLSFSSTALNSSVDTSHHAKPGEQKLFCQMMIGNLPSAVVLPYSACTVPAGINGPVAIFVTIDDQALANNVLIQTTVTVLAGPTMAFIDTITQDIDVVVKSGSASSSSGSGNSSSGSGSSSSGSGSGSSSSGGGSGSSSSGSGSGTATASASDSTSTTTISPGDASSIESSASATASAGGASATGSATGALANGSTTGSSTDVTLAVGGPNEYVGPAPDGHTFVMGWSTPS
ncbi:hypothetical protein FIBSPDRAFT_1048337 [Athelia psychrophila]|uniref:Ferritin-like domain-containing protein n=1 Tax=Athelia psychrophila TaxID=1759441 RepID=A0A166DV09_9AGAM|nr:hypothetical protein FIBSPDRAFT_1048337 [Fibularhizoctonia sp. CBS 109695]